MHEVFEFLLRFFIYIKTRRKNLYICFFMKEKIFDLWRSASQKTCIIQKYKVLMQTCANDKGFVTSQNS
jgi:hypothetical protein